MSREIHTRAAGSEIEKTSVQGKTTGSPRLEILLQIFRNLCLITAGSVLCAVAINGILVPRQFLSGGFTGLSLIIHYLSPAIPLGGIYFLLNVPLFALGWKYVGRRNGYSFGDAL